MSYIEENFLLENDYAVKLYQDFAKEMPIFDYHCHLSEYQIYEDKEFKAGAFYGNTFYCAHSRNFDL